MDSQLLVTEQIEAGARLLDRLGRVMPVVAGFWVKRFDLSHWSLYVATDWAATVDGLTRAARELSAAAEGEHAWDDNRLGYRFVRPDSKVAQAVLAFHREFPQLVPRRYRGLMLGDVPIDEAYLYPLPAAQPVAA